MQKVFLVSALALSLLGCASSPPQPVGTLSSMELCKMAVNGSYQYDQASINYILGIRKENCQAYLGIIQAQNAERQAGIASGINLLQAARPQATGVYQQPSTGFVKFLKSSYTQQGSQMCAYDDGSVINIGIGLCPLSRK